MKKLSAFTLFILSCVFSYGQEREQAPGWMTKQLTERVFIQNNGQFEEKYNDGAGKVLFYTSGDVNMNWSASGLTYEVTETYLDQEAQRELAREMKKGGEYGEELREKMRFRYHFFHMQWMDANPDPEIIAADPVSYYYTFANPAVRIGASGIKASACKKITYKNIYPGIDAEYILPEKGGIKYSFIVHPGADISRIRMHYTGADNVNLNSKSEIEINTRNCGSYLEHQPESYYEDGTKVGSSFSFQKGVVGFNVPGYDKTKTLIIDPWQGVVSFPNTNTVDPKSKIYAKTGYDVCYDYKGNAWVLGGDQSTSFYVGKYNNAGALLWKFQIPMPALGPYSTVTNMVGDIDVNKSTSTCYVAQGADVWASLSGAKMYKLNSAGTQVAYFPGHKNCGEISRLRLTCEGRLYGTGGGINAQGLYQLFTIDTNLTTMTGIHATTSPNGDHDTNLMTLDPSGDYMYNNFNYPAPGSPDFKHNNEMHKTPIPGLGSAAWVNPGPIYAFTELNSIAYAGPSPGAFGSMPCNFNMFNGMVCGNGFLYTYNGDTIKKWDKGTGAKVGEVKTNGKRYWNGGLDIDLCEYVYASVGNAVKVYDKNFNLVKTYPLPDTSCYDIKIDRIHDLLYATGVGYVCAIAITPPVLQLTTSITPTGCGGCTGKASAEISCNVAAFKYLWLPGGQTTSEITSQCAGTYTCIASTTEGCAKTIGDTVVAVIPNSAGAPPSATVNHVDANCGSPDGSGTASATGGVGPYSYNWAPSGGTNAAATGLPPGNYTVTVTDAVGCMDTKTVTIASVGSLVLVTNNSTICAGQNATLTASGGTSYVWSTGETTSAIVVANPTSSASYSVTATDNSGCSGTGSPAIIISPPPVAQAADITVCAGQSSTLTASGGGTYSWNTGNTTASINISPTANTSYTVIVAFGTCTDTASANATVIPAPIAALGSDQTICPGQNATLDAGNSGSVYLWSTGETTQTIEVSGVGTYWVFAAQNNCVAKDTISTFIAPQVNLSDSNLCSISPIVLDPGAGASSYLWSNGSTTQTISVQEAGSFWVVALFGNCLSGDSATITGDGTGGSMYVPNAFTPNDDFLNDIFLAKGTGIATFDMHVFDRWGNLVFVSKDINNGWTGAIQGEHYPFKNDGEEPSQEDVYVWKIDYTTQCFPGQVKKAIGVVSIIK